MYMCVCMYTYTYIYIYIYIYIHSAAQAREHSHVCCFLIVTVYCLYYLLCTVFAVMLLLFVGLHTDAACCAHTAALFARL